MGSYFCMPVAVRAACILEGVESTLAKERESRLRRKHLAIDIRYPLNAVCLYVLR